VLYDKYCVSCHKEIKRSDPRRTVRAQMLKLSLIGTDPKTAENIVNYVGFSWKRFQVFSDGVE